MTQHGEGFDPSDGPARRGRRDPQLQDVLDAEGAVGDHGDADPTEYALVAGDIILAKVTIAGPTEIGDSWITYGVQSRVIDGESEGAAFDRVATITNERVFALAEDVAQRAALVVETQREAALERARTHRITPR